LRRFAVALLAAPVLAAVYLKLLLRRSVAARVGLLLGVGALLGVAGFGALAPDDTTALPPGDVAATLPRAEFRTTLRTGQGLNEPVVLEFSAPMDEASVAAALTVDPPTAVGLAWGPEGDRLTVAPTAGWTPGTYVVVTVAGTARDRAGTPLGSPARAAFLSRSPDRQVRGAHASDGRVPVHDVRHHGRGRCRCRRRADAVRRTESSRISVSTSRPGHAVRPATGGSSS
jgi:hypothetical protein